MNRLLALAAIAALASSPALAATTHAKKHATTESHAMLHSADRGTLSEPNAAYVAGPYGGTDPWPVMVDAQKLDPNAP